MFKKVISKILVLVLVFTVFSTYESASTLADGVGPVYLKDGTTVLVDAPPAGLLTKIQDTGDGFITISTILKGYVGWTSVTSAMSYSKDVVVPVNVTTKVDMDDTKFSTGSKISPFVELLVTPANPTFWSIGGQLENTTDGADGNFFSVKYERSSGSDLMTVAASEEVTVFKQMFRKIDPKKALDATTFTYLQMSASIVTKFAQGTSQVAREGTEVTGANPYFIRPDLFYIELIAPSPTPKPTAKPTPLPTVKAPTINVVTDSLKIISGKAVSGGTVNVTVGTKKYSVKAVSGAWKISISSPVAAGTKISAVVKSGIISSASKTVYVIPSTPKVSALKANSIYVKGTATKGATVYLKIGTKSYNTKASSKNGAFSAKVLNLKKGSTVTVSCKAGGQMSSSLIVKVK